MMHIHLSPDATSLGLHAALETADILRTAIAKDGVARMVVSTGASQFTTFEALLKQPDIDWSKVEMFHLDEYVDLPPTHIASFQKYLHERFVDIVHVGKAFFVGNSPDCISALTAELNRMPVHVGLIGIGQNAHIAFNDPPADFETQDAYLVINLDDETCRSQQVQEGWFATTNDVPKQALTMSVSRIMKCEKIISAVPYAVKASAVERTLYNSLTNEIPATILKTHPSFSLHVDKDSFGSVDVHKILPAHGQTSFDFTVYNQ